MGEDSSKNYMFVYYNILVRIRKIDSLSHEISLFCRIRKGDLHMNRYILTKAGIDVNEGIHRFNGNKELYEKFLTSFPEDIHYEQMLEAIEQKDVDAAFQGAHALKGITGTVSLAKLHSLLIPLVEELRAGSMEKVPELLPPVKEAYDEAVQVIKEQRG